MCTTCHNISSRDNTVYKVTYFDHGRPKVSGGHSKTSADQAAQRLSAKVGIRNVVVQATNEKFAAPNYDIF